MSIEQYKNSDLILKEIKPNEGLRFTVNDFDLLKPIPANSTFGMVDSIPPSTVNQAFNYKNATDQVEMHIYTTDGGYLDSNYQIQNWKLYYRKTDGELDSKIRLDVHNDIRTLGYRRGSYKIVYNFLRNHIGAYNSLGKLFIDEISATRTELILKLTHPENISSRNEFEEFTNIKSIESDYYYDYVLNFTDNKILKVINTMRLSDTELLVKLYEPLPEDIDENFQCWLQSEVLEPYIDNITLYPASVEEPKNNLRGPNFNVEIDYWTSTETELKNWNELLSDSATTSQQLIDSYFSGSLSGIDLNVRYNDFENFVHFSSAEERVRNFVYKLNLIERYDSELNLLDNTTGSLAGNRINTVKKRNSVISGFDNFEKYLYFEATGSIYTYPGSSSVDPFPKVSTEISNVTEFTWEDAYQAWYEANILFGGEADTTTISATYPYSLYSVTSSAAKDWIDDVLETAKDYDRQNLHSLRKTIPEHIRQNSDNENYELFVDMIGQHFDILWTYINSLSDINKRQEHPDDEGLSEDLLYDVAKGYGWTLTNGNQISDLWEYTLGTNESGVLQQSGSRGVRTKAAEERTKEVWRRIVNNLPYILKSKGTARSIKALLSCYGVPSSVLGIKEYGGPTQYDEKPNYEYSKLEHLTQFTGTEYLTIPWKQIKNSTGSYSYPDTIEMRVFPHSGTEYKYGSRGETMLFAVRDGADSLFGVTFEATSSNNEKGTVNFYIDGDNGYLTASVQDNYILDGNPFHLSLNRSVTDDNSDTIQTYTLGVRKDKYEEILSVATASIVVSGSAGVTSQSYNDSWLTDGTMYIGSGSSLGVSYSGSLQEVRYWSRILSSSVLDNHTLNARSYVGNSETASYYDLFFRIPLSNEDINYSETSSIDSIHPNQNIEYFSDGATPLSASLFNFTSESYTAETYTYKTDAPSIGNGSIYSDKIRIDDNTLSGRLSVDSKAELSEYKKAPVDNNRLTVAFSPQDIINEDIFEHMGYFKIDNYIGDPSNRNRIEYPRLKNLSKEYWKKYSNKNDFVDYIKLLGLYDFSLFHQIKQLLPLRANKILGLLVEPNVLERSKVNAEQEISLVDNLNYETELDRPGLLFTTASYDTFPNGTVQWEDLQTITSSYNSNSASLDLDNEWVISGENSEYSSSLSLLILNLFGSYIGNTSGSYCGLFINENYENKSIYKRFNAIKKSGSLEDVGFGFGWVTQSNAEDIWNPLGDSVDGLRQDDYYKVNQYYYSSSTSASLGKYYSSSLSQSNSPNPNNKPLGVKKYRFLGTKISGQGINVNSSETIDGGPVVESYDTPGNELYNTEYGASGSLTVE